MKITQIMLSKGFGGGERVFVDMCLALAASGHLIQAVCHPEFEGRTFLSHENILTADLKVRWDYSPVARYRIKKIIALFGPDIIHTHMARASMIGGYAGNRMGIPAAANLHNYVKLKYYRHIIHFFPGTPDQKQYLINNEINAQDITVIPHFSRIPAVDAVNAHDRTDNIILSYGRFVREKGFDILIKSIGFLRNQGVDVHLILGGDGPEKENLTTLVEKLDLKNHVRFSGWVEDIPRFLYQSRIFILPSLREAFGVAMLEAMARGKTIVASQTPGPLEVLDDTTGYLFPIGDTERLADLIHYALTHEKESYEKAVNAHHKYMTTYTPEKVVAVFESSYRRLAKKDNKL